jgi:trans-AT polyketide synthase/acyltransferase/oxidoreductase domain-containing protein
MDVRDTTYAPAGDMFELGARIQVLKKGLFFPARANKLYALYCQHSSLEALDQKTRNELEDKYFRRSLAAVWEETRAYYLAHDPEQVERAERDAKHKMALVFRWYFVHTMRLALNGSKDQQVDYQVHCGPALGAFNRWVKGTELENWRNRHVDVIAERLMQGTAVLLGNRFQSLYGLRQEDEGLAQPSLSAAHSVHAGSRADCIDDPGVTSKISGRS